RRAGWTLRLRGPAGSRSSIPGEHPLRPGWNAREAGTRSDAGSRGDILCPHSPERKSRRRCKPDAVSTDAVRAVVHHWLPAAGDTAIDQRDTLHMGCADPRGIDLVHRRCDGRARARGRSQGHDQSGPARDYDRYGLALRPDRTEPRADPLPAHQLIGRIVRLRNLPAGVASLEQAQAGSAAQLVITTSTP